MHLPGFSLASALLVMVLLVLLAGNVLTQQVRFNRFALQSLGLLTGEDHAELDSLETVSSAPQDCRRHWFLGHLAGAASDPQRRDSEWEAAMRCDSRFVMLAAIALPDHQALARRAIELRPDSAEAWFWLADIRRVAAPEEAQELYRRGIALDPTNGLAWRSLGDLLRPKAPQAAITAYLQSCLNGDPGYNGCGRAGGLAEELGDLEGAIRYYRLSLWSTAQQRANELELQLVP